MATEYEPGGLEDTLYGLGRWFFELYGRRPSPQDTRNEVDEWDRLHPVEQAELRKAHLRGYRDARAA